MTAYHEKSWQERYGSLGDMAEAAFKLAFPHGWVETGLRRPPFKMSGLSNAVRHTPDFLTRHGYVECKGFGRDRILKVKEEDITAWAVWSSIAETPVSIFVYDHHTDSYTMIADYNDLLDLPCVAGRFSDNDKPYFGFHADDMAKFFWCQLLRAA